MYSLLSTNKDHVRSISEKKENYKFFASVENVNSIFINSMDLSIDILIYQFVIDKIDSDRLS